MSDMKEIEFEEAFELDTGDEDFADKINDETSFEEVVDEEIEQEEKSDPRDPVDFFGDASLTGNPILERGTLPDVIWDFAEDNARSIGTNPEAIAAGCLVAVATAIPEGFTVQPKLHVKKWREKPILWSGLSGNSGANKTATMKAPFAPIFTIQKSLVEENKELAKGYKKDMLQWKADCAHAAKEGHRIPDEPEKPIMKRLFMKDAGLEKSIEICADNPRGVAIFRDEIAAWIGGFGKYNGAGDSEKATWLEGYNGDPATVDRMSREVHCDSFGVNVYGGIQDDVVRKRLSKMDADGFMARFLFVNPRPCFGEDFLENENAEQAYSDLIQKIYDLELPHAHSEKGWAVQMTPEAAAMGADLRMQRMLIQKLPTIDQGLSEHLSKWDGLWARLCLILHMIKFVSDDVWTQEESPLCDVFETSTVKDGDVKTKQGELKTPARKISEETAIQARDLLVKFFLPEAVRMYTQVLATDDNMQHARWLAGHILAHGVKEITVYQIGRIYRPLAKDHRALGEAMNALELMGWLWSDGGKAAVGDFRKMKWTISPRVHVLFAEHAKAEKIRRSKAVAEIREAKKAADRLRIGT
ncbi:DUF3987 domain-containing protein [Roseovarius sp. S4756]|uniref:DUF3987 domain-containing protein n=1 Tax=Roseovarius maritimus TaxID=3342637 RepID=UPI00372C4F48